MSSLPTGTIIIYALNTLPDGFFFCNGDPIYRDSYTDLFNIIGTTYGSGDGSSTFNLPNLLDKSPVQGESLGQIGGNNNVTIISDNLPLHTHSPNLGFSQHSHEIDFVKNPYGDENSRYFDQAYSINGDSESNRNNGIDRTYEVAHLDFSTGVYSVQIYEDTDSFGNGKSLNIQNKQISLNYIIKY
jgi:microcystin-dependent protein